MLYDGIVQELDEEGFVSHETRFGQMEIVTDQDADVFLGNQRTTTEMNRKETEAAHRKVSKKRAAGFVLCGGLPYEACAAHVIIHLLLICGSLTLYSRAGRSFGVAVSLAVLFLYYVGMSVARSLGVNGFCRRL